MPVDAILPLIIVGGILCYLILNILLFAWVWADASSRGKPGCLVAVLVFFTFPLGLLVWIVARPEPERRMRY